MPLVITSLKKADPLVWSMESGDVFPSIQASSIGELAADGEELKLIAQHFKNVPLVAKAESMRWVGSLAQTIFANFHPLFLRKGTKKKPTTRPGVVTM